MCNYVFVLKPFNLFQVSPLVGDKGLDIGDNVKKIGNCLVSDVDSWLSCINKTSNMPQMGQLQQKCFAI